MTSEHFHPRTLCARSLCSTVCVFVCVCQYCGQSFKRQGIQNHQKNPLSIICTRPMVDKCRNSLCECKCGDFGLLMVLVIYYNTNNLRDLL